MTTVAYQGEPGSYSEEAVWRRFAGEGVRGLPCATFDEAARAVAEGRADLVLLPVQNTLAGPIEDAKRAAADAGLTEQRGFWLAIEHCLIGHLDAALSDIRRIHSQQAALDQCREYLEGLGVELVAEEDTAGAVRKVKESGDKAAAAIGSARAAAKHGMQVLARGVQDAGDNRTRFVLYARARVHK